MKQIITISREFGSGGHVIGERLAQELKIPYYDKEIIEKIAAQTNLSTKYIEEQAEHAPTKSLFSYGLIGRDASGSSVVDQIFAAQSQIIRDLASKGPCGIVGRCADFILQDDP